MWIVFLFLANNYRRTILTNDHILQVYCDSFKFSKFIILIFQTIGVSNIIKFIPVGFQAKILEFSPYQKTKGTHDK